MSDEPGFVYYPPLVGGHGGWIPWNWFWIKLQYPMKSTNNKQNISGMFIHHLFSIYRKS